MATKIAEMVRNSPLGRRKAGGYSPVVVATEDPFVQGISFNAHLVASIESPDTTGTEAVQNAVSAALDETQKSSKSLRKIKFIIKAVSLTVRDVADKTEVTYPIYLVSYCGNSRDANTVFYILHKTKVDRITRAEIFKCDSPAKVGAISRTVSKAFNVAYKAWCAKKRMNEKKLGTDSPLLKRATASDVPKKDVAQKPTEGVPQQFHTPPIPRKDSPEKAAAAGVRRSGSFGEKDAPSIVISPNMQRVKVQNEVTGSTHDVTITDDLDEGFKDLALNRHGGGRPLSITSPDQKPEAFTYDDIKQHADKPDDDEPLIEF